MLEKLYDILNKKVSSTSRIFSTISEDIFYLNIKRKNSDMLLFKLYELDNNFIIKGVKKTKSKDIKKNILHVKLILKMYFSNNTNQKNLFLLSSKNKDIEIYYDSNKFINLNKKTDIKKYKKNNKKNFEKLKKIKHKQYLKNRALKSLLLDLKNEDININFEI